MTAAVISTATRTLTATSAAIPELAGGPALVPTKISGTEFINELFEYTLDLKTPDDLNFQLSQAADFNLDSFIGHEISVRLQLQEHHGAAPNERQINAIIADAQFLHGEGRHIRYRLTLRPWLWLLTKTRDHRIFQDTPVVALLDKLFEDYPFPVEKRLVEDYPIRDYQVQYGESDYSFFCRLAQEWGIHWHFEHSGGAHRLILSDHMNVFRPMPEESYRNIEFHPLGDKKDEENIHALSPIHQLVSGRYATRDYDYIRPKSTLDAAREDARDTLHNRAEIFEWHASRSGGSHYAQPKAGPNQQGNDPFAEGGQFALLRMEALRSPGARATGSGRLRGLVPGHTFALSRHPSAAANQEYLVLHTELTVEETGEESQAGDGGSALLREQAWDVKTGFTLHPARGVAYREEPKVSKPRTYGPQTALVVGPPGANIHTDWLGRIKVSFQWDRYAGRDQNDTCWIRVSSPWAGNELGGMHLPRIGEEVIIDFIGGDPDLPICTGRVFNQMNLPPWELPSQQALSGFRSRELVPGGGNAASGRSNHLVMDDTHQQIQTKLRSDHQASELTLGYNTRIQTNAGREEKRGEGYELRTDGHGAQRAAAGMYFTTHARNGAEHHALDCDETRERLTKAERQHRDLAAYARQHGAQIAGDQDAVSDLIKTQNEAIAGSGDLGEFSSPQMLFSGALGIEASAKESIHLHSGQSTALTAEQNLSHSVGRSWFAAVQKKISFFAHQLGMRFIAAMGVIRIEAEGDELQLLAQKVATLLSNEDWVNIVGKKGVLINGGGSYAKFWPGGIELGTPEGYTLYSKSVVHLGPRGMPVPGKPSVCEECLEKAAGGASMAVAKGI